MTKIYYREALGALIVFDLTNEVSFNSVKLWKLGIDLNVHLPDANETPIPVILLANKVFIFIFIINYSYLCLCI